MTTTNLNNKDLIRPDLHSYCGADNLAFNEKIKQMMKAGRRIFHFGFGQAPFPVCEPMVEALKEHAGQMAYLPVQGNKQTQWIYNIVLSDYGLCYRKQMLLYRFNNYFLCWLMA